MYVLPYASAHVLDCRPRPIDTSNAEGWEDVVAGKFSPVGKASTPMQQQHSKKIMKRPKTAGTSSSSSNKKRVQVLISYLILCIV